jgi:hypothetical protein
MVNQSLVYSPPDVRDRLNYRFGFADFQAEAV